MRLIDADALINRMYHDAFETDTDMQKWDSGCWIRYKMFENAIDDAPTIDAVEVVRCKDCVDMFHDDWYKCFACANLYGLNEEVKPDDYCSHGERKESE